MASDEKVLLKADGFMLDKKHAEAMTLIKSLITITSDTLEFSNEDFNMQKLFLIRLQRIYTSSGNTVPVPLEKLIKYYDIIARNHPGENVALDQKEAEICGLVLDWLPVIQKDNTLAQADDTRAKQLTDGIIFLLDTNKRKYKLGVFYNKGF